MKKILFSIVVLLSSTLNAQKGNINVELISYRVPIAYSIYGTEDPSSLDPYSVYQEMFSNWYREKFDPSTYNLFVHQVYDAATTGKITVYDPYLLEIKGSKVSFTAMQVNDVKNIGSFTDTVMIQDPYPPYEMHDTVFTAVFDVYNILAIDFLETWMINSGTLKMTKKVIAFAPVMAVYDRNTGVLKGMAPMFWVKM